MAVENNTITSLSPSFIGTEPVIFTYNGVDYEIVVDRHQSRYQVLASLNETHQEKGGEIHRLFL
ncbi:hypothetical protein E1160_09270 [Rhodospirillaceae bacterium RKSG073]|nr:hypothetical protein [Curvivirga aplysinae]